MTKQIVRHTTGTRLVRRRCPQFTSGIGSHRARAFSLIELIAVLALMSIAVVIVARNAFTQITEASRQGDERSLAGLGTAARDYVIRTRILTNDAGLASTMATELAVPVGKIKKSLAGYSRSFLTDPALRLGTKTNGTLSYTQTSAGCSNQPLNLRLLIVSSVVQNLPAAATNATNFTEIWGTAEGAAPVSWTGWGKYGDDLQVERIDMKDLFRRVILQNLDPVQTAWYQVQSTNQISLACGQRREAWFIERTPFTFLYANKELQAQELISEDVSYVHENGRWARSPRYGQETFSQLVDGFLKAGMGSPNYGATPQATIDEFYTYLRNYGTWANDAFGGTNRSQHPSFRKLKDSETRLKSFTYNLIN